MQALFQKLAVGQWHYKDAISCHVCSQGSWANSRKPPWETLLVVSSALVCGFLVRDGMIEKSLDLGRDTWPFLI